MPNFDWSDEPTPTGMFDPESERRMRCGCPDYAFDPEPCDECGKTPTKVPEPPLYDERCFCGGTFSPVSVEDGIERWECLLCEIPVDRRMSP